MQNKLRLDLEDLSVESFDTTSAEHRHEGTVFGQQCTCYTQCTCPGCPTCNASCNGTCAGTCNGTCGENTCAASCYGTCEYSCDGCHSNHEYCTFYDYTCRNYGTCNPYEHCAPIP